jgi:3-hydroxyisobutyrate dehydrogenase-like beta-hydroxyacid dehydrogenase
MLIGLVHPGEMGASVGGAAVAAGHEVRWASAGRSPESVARASAAGLVDAGSLAALVASVPVLVSIVPPHAAVAQAEEVLAAGFAGTYVDANAISPATARSIGAAVTAAGGAFVDGAIIGGPVGAGGSTRLYLAGAAAVNLVGVFAGSGLDMTVLPGTVGAASALKAAYAGWTKGSAALLLSMRALARAEGVEAALVAECDDSLPDLARRTAAAARSAATKGWRWVGEMEQIAAALAAQGLPAGFHDAAAETYRRVPRGTAGEVDPVVAALLAAVVGRTGADVTG